MEFRVLVPIDDDEERAVAQARTAASLPGADRDIEVTLLHVDDDTSEDEQRSIRLLGSGKRAIEELDDHGVSVEPLVRSGDPAAGILDAAEDIGADLIIVGGRKRSPLGSALFGSVSQAVVRDADRPVTITGDSPPAEPTHICRSCGKRYYSAVVGEIGTCRSCGGTHVEIVH